MCKHEECPYKYCPYHKDYDETLNVISKCAIPDLEYGDTVESCMSYLDI